ncbi:MAG: hypothetical protein U0795_19740 [Pirellulales bacterium]
MVHNNLPSIAAYCRYLPLIAELPARDGLKVGRRKFRTGRELAHLFAANCRLLPLVAAYCRL